MELKLPWKGNTCVLLGVKGLTNIIANGRLAVCSVNALHILSGLWTKIQACKYRLKQFWTINFIGNCAGLLERQAIIEAREFRRQL